MMKGKAMYEKHENITEPYCGSIGNHPDQHLTAKRQSGLDLSLQNYDSCLERATKLLSQLNSATNRLAGPIPENPNGCAKDSINSSGVAYEVGYRCAHLDEILDGIESATQRLTDI